MTIKEIEELSGMTRANIRFYESEGLLSPERCSNGYRDYSENDLEVLKRIKLLRTLHISLEEIKLLQAGDRELIETLDRHLESLRSEKIRLEQSQEICKVMRSDGVRYQTLDAQRYLDEMESILHKPVPGLTEDTVPQVRSPWRRFFARSLDGFIYSALWTIFLSAVMNVNVTNGGSGKSLLDTLVASLLMLFIEPAMLSLFGTTAGKKLLGLSVTDNDGRRLSYTEAFFRTWTVLLKGMGLNIPIYNLVRYWKSYKACSEGETLEWEYDSTISLRDEKGWRTAAFIGVYVIVAGILVLTISVAPMPKHRGEITVAEFCDNYNQLSDYYGIETGSSLNKSGKWVESGGSADVIYDFDVTADEPEFLFTEKNGAMTGMAFSTELHDSDAWAPDYQNEMMLSILSFVRAQKGCGPFSKDIKEIAKKISDYPFESYKFTVYGVSITCDIEYSGYTDTASAGILLPAEGEETDYSFHFEMIKG